MSVRTQGTALFTAILVLVASTVIIQLWLLAVSMEALLSHQMQTLIPASLASTVLLAINAAFLRYVFRYDHELQANRQE